MPKDLLVNARKKRVVILEDLDFVWDQPELNEIAQMWNRSLSVNYMAEHFNRDPDELLMAIIHLARNDKLVPRKYGLKG
ncbi:hypothetical protein J1P26_21935 [Neobacillus sp. MM2021_6]|uniref:hypothetical protein n=1 Tax=Bacillaceae TaxID=186817 RepID=UPI00140D9CC8|nr:MULTISPECIES: hypothetical protein [Bacillaceae]MBO0962368.1 hypothetical protein [Neobacillus sp. MM2021_6]NHC20851.1 hypothetical protein [Bacillus sp. MM2020_4]